MSLSLNLKDSWNLSVNAAGLLEFEITTRVDHLQNGDNILVVQGESQPRMINEKLTYVYKKFQKGFALPRNVMIDTKSHGFTNGILIISFQKQIE
jgi:HSP20 family molecular chaperone IbpA